MEHAYHPPLGEPVRAPVPAGQVVIEHDRSVNYNEHRMAQAALGDLVRFAPIAFRCRNGQFHVTVTVGKAPVTLSDPNFITAFSRAEALYRSYFPTASQEAA